VIHAEGKWPKDIRKWRVVLRTVDRRFFYVTQFKRGWWLFSEWHDVGYHHDCSESADQWIRQQCQTPVAPVESVVITYRYDGDA
jgi:hypothetical protein